MTQRECEAALTTLPSLDLAQLREQWAQHCDTSAPKVSAGLLRLWLAWELQAKAMGGLPRSVAVKLDQLAEGKVRGGPVNPGTQLVREWKGTVHVVTIAEDGAIVWNGKTWPSLSRVAREITGTRWSGPAFFGLKQKAAA